MPPMGRHPGPDPYSMPCVSFADIQAISAKVGEAARAIQVAATRDSRVSGGRFLARIAVVIFDRPGKRRLYFSALKPTKKYGRKAGERDTCDGISTDSLIASAASALASGDPLAALKRNVLRDDAPALALRGIAMAQIGDLARAKQLLRNAARSFGTRESMDRAPCTVAEAETALVSRDLGRPMELGIPWCW